MKKEVAESELKWFLTPETFGMGGPLGGVLRRLNLSEKDQLRVSAWYHACPQPDKVAEVYGIKWAIKRYDECNRFTQEIWKMAQKKPFLYWALKTPTRREPGEFVGIYEPGAVPESHKMIISPLSNICGFATPRLAIEIEGRGVEYSDERRFMALKLLEEVILISSDPIELLANYSEKALEAGVDPLKILGHVLTTDIMPEENCRAIYKELMDELKIKAPKLWTHYEKLSNEERQKNGIINRL